MAPFFSKDYEMKIIQITDIHLTTEGKSILGRDPNLNFQNVLNHINENQYDAEVIIITGDLSDWGETSDYLRLKNIIEKNKIPIHLCIGNHDDRANFLSVFPTLSVILIGTVIEPPPVINDVGTLPVICLFEGLKPNQLASEDRPVEAENAVFNA